MQSWRCSRRTPQIPQRLGQCPLHTSRFGSRCSNARRAALWGAAGVVAMAGAEQTVTEPVSGYGVVLSSVCYRFGTHSQRAICSATCIAAAHQLLLCRGASAASKHITHPSIEHSAVYLKGNSAHWVWVRAGHWSPVSAGCTLLGGGHTLPLHGRWCAVEEIRLHWRQGEASGIQRHHVALVEVLPASDTNKGLGDVWQPQRAQKLAEQSAARLPSQPAAS